MKQETETEYQVLPQAELFAVMNENGRFQFMSLNCEEHLGFTSAEFIGTFMKDYVHKDDLFLVESYFYNEHHLHPCTFRFLMKNGTFIWLEATVDFIKTTSAKKENQIVLKIKLLKSSEQENRSKPVQLNNPLLTDEAKEINLYAEELLKRMPCPLFISQKGQLCYVNQALIDLLGGTSKEDLLGLDVLDIIDHDYHDIVKNRIQRMQRGSYVGLIEQTWRRLDGTPVEVEIKAAPTLFNGQPAELVVLIDISSRKKFQKILQKSRERYQLLIQNSIDTIAVIHREKWVFINESGVKLFEADDYPDMLGKSIFSSLDPEYHEQVKEKLHNIVHLRTDVEVTKQSWHTYKNSTIYTEMVCIPTTYFGEPAVQVILRDISDRKKAEELMLRSEKLSVAGQLAAGIAHEIRNPLTAIKGFLQLMRSAGKGEETYFDIVFSELNRIELILSELLMLAKPQERILKETNLYTLIGDVATLLETQAIMNNVMIVHQHQQDQMWINCDQNQIKQVFINLIKNAIDSMPKGGKVTLSSIKEGDYILVHVIDEGEGIPPEALKKIGEPFYTTKEKGTGLGLMITYKIIENHKGSISIESELGQGTVFTLKLPSAETEKN
ncbi:PAS domain-containing sensor histidine kinase [Bacillus sp. HMSC76G11]|uniref:histidine kinase n=1 Tax=Metabacillus idriensis TaxID=324768 RepID=A0A6I2M7C1_9BACI|nr:PAS domain S-box protein [Metabacillus idriensis]MRX53357.1 PAS domain S-box protein [Metabacillus idriensis]OHR65286.1 PAS domain-containing sensor histidine kinase [Bacillus sp. HMSC76G11]